MHGAHEGFRRNYNLYYEWLYSCDAHSDYMSGALIVRCASALMALLALIQMYL